MGPKDDGSDPLTLSTSNAANRERLKEIIRERSFSDDREMTLASGRRSWVYFNMKPTMLDPEGAFLLGELILDAVSDSQVDYVGGMEIGSVPMVSFVAAASFRRSAERALRAFFVRKKPKDHGTKSRIEGLAPGESLAGKRVLMVEDVTTTGGSILDAIHQVQETDAHIMGVLTIVDRQEGAREALEEKGLSLTALFTADEFTEKK